MIISPLSKSISEKFLFLILFAFTINIFLACGQESSSESNPEEKSLQGSPAEMIRGLTLEFDPERPVGIARSVIEGEYKKACDLGYEFGCQYEKWDRSIEKEHERLEAAYNLFGKSCTDDIKDSGACLVISNYFHVSQRLCPISQKRNILHVLARFLDFFCTF